MSFKWREFATDVPRIKIFIDNKFIQSKDPFVILRRIVDIFGDYEVERICYYMCQQCLACHFIKEVETNVQPSEQLVSRGKHEVHVNTVDKSIVVVKDFLKLYMFRDDTFIVDNCTLTLQYDSKTHKETAIWSYFL